MNNAHRLAGTLAVALTTLSITARAQSAAPGASASPSPPPSALPTPATAASPAPQPAARLSAASASGPAAFEMNPASRLWAVRASLELGALAVLSHTIQYSQTGSTVDYVREGGQSTLVPFMRMGAEIELNHHHNFVFLYQPIDLRTQVRLQRDLLIDNVPFTRGSAVDFRYGFDFYRASYMYDFFAEPNHELSVGLSFQIRNTAISFTSVDGTSRVANSNLGLVPALKARGRFGLRSGVFVGFEIDGSYAAVPGLNGSDIPFEGAIVDGSLRAGVRLWGPTEVFLNVRYLGGGSRGTGRNPSPPGDGFNSNWLHTMSISIGANIR